MRFFVISCALAVMNACGAANPSRPVPVDRTGELWPRMKQSLPGRWTAPNEEGNLIRVEYRLISNESALIETFVTPSGRETMTVYYPGDHGVMLTHYCAQGNQVRLVEDSDTYAAFAYLDATHLAADQDVMRGLSFRFFEGGFDQTSVYRTSAGIDETSTLHFTRVAE